MNALLLLIPAALILGGIGLAAFLWSLRSGQYEDLDGAAHRILFDEPVARPAEPVSVSTPTQPPHTPNAVATTAAQEK